MSKAFTIKNRYVLSLATWLQELSLGGRESRERTRFVTVLNDHLKTVEADRMKLLEGLTKKDEKGVAITKKNDKDQEVFDLGDNVEAFAKDYNELLDEEFVLDVLEGHKAKLKTTKEIVLETDYKFGPREGDDDAKRVERIRQSAEYDEWAKAFEALELE